MVSAEQKTGEQNGAQELRLWEVTYSRPNGELAGENEFDWTSATIVVAGISQEDARKEAEQHLHAVEMAIRIENARLLTCVPYQGDTLDILLRPRKVVA